MLKVPKSEEPFDDAPMMPPTDMNNGGQMPMAQPTDMGGGDQMSGQPPIDDFSTTSDDDVEIDPKKEIEKLTGELSQKLRLYNEENNDRELSKYVGGMIAAQVGKNLNASDKKKIVKKLNGSDDDLMGMVGDGQDEMEMDDDGQDAMAPMEAKIKRSVNLSEVLNNLMYDDESQKTRASKDIRNKKIDKKDNPFVCH